MMAINLESQIQFIINNVISMHTVNIPSKEQYEKLIQKAEKKNKSTSII